MESKLKWRVLQYLQCASHTVSACQLRHLFKGTTFTMVSQWWHILYDTNCWFQSKFRKCGCLHERTMKNNQCLLPRLFLALDSPMSPFSFALHTFQPFKLKSHIFTRDTIPMLMWARLFMLNLNRKISGCSETHLKDTGWTHFSNTERVSSGSPFTHSVG